MRTKYCVEVAWNSWDGKTWEDTQCFDNLSEAHAFIDKMQTYYNKYYHLTKLILITTTKIDYLSIDKIENM